VPWESLQPGDTVRIHARATPYKEKFVICRQGTGAQPITVQGVPDVSGNLPVLEGIGATTRPVLSYWNQDRCIIKIGGASVPPDTTPKYIVVENLVIRSARPPYTYGSGTAYTKQASAIYIEKGEYITVRNCTMHDCGNGFFIGSSDAQATRHVLVEGNYIYDNGNANSAFEHNNYTAGIDVVFQYNRFGPPRAGTIGNNLKDRSAGLVVRYNWIEGGNRQLDLVDGEDSALIRNHPDYHDTFVYGNVLIEPNGAGNNQICHYGGDSGAEANYRKGTLHFYNNTVLSQRSGTTTLFRLSTNAEAADVRDNLVYVTSSGGNLAMCDGTGTVDLRNNWFKTGWKNTHEPVLLGTVNNIFTITGADPGFADLAGQNFRLVSGSPCRDAGTAWDAEAAASHPVIRHYEKHQTSSPRAASAAIDIGAYEFTPPDPVEAWKQQHFGPDAGNPLIAGDLADPDGDGLVNLEEYGLDTDPLAASPAPLGTSLVTVGPNQHLALAFLRRPPPAGIFYTVQVSGDLTVWQNGSTYGDAGETPDTPATVEAGRLGSVITVRDASAVGLSTRFMRVKITR
jgi:hypothetical protein